MKISKMMGVVLLAGMVFSGIVSAHDYLGTLGSSPTATDKFYFQCLKSNNAKLTFQVLRWSGASCVTATYLVTGANSTSCGVLSPIITVQTGAGAKLFTVKKSPAATGNLSYTVRAFCRDNTGSIDPDYQTIQHVYLQNQ